jgi:hypothetical protein
LKKSNPAAKKKEADQNHFEHVQFQVTKEKPFEVNKQSSISLEINEINEVEPSPVIEKKKRGRKPKQEPVPDSLPAADPEPEVS